MSERIKKILVVDDQKQWLESIASVLEDIECVVEVAKTYNEAQTKFTNEKFDLCIIDIRVQEHIDYDVQGIDLLEWIYKSQQGYPPVIVLTGHLVPGLEQKVKWYGAYAILEKSYTEKGFDFNKELFLKTVKNALQSLSVKES